MNRATSFLRNAIIALTALLICGDASRAQRSPAQVGDSLRNLYLSAERSGERFIVDQGYGKALFNLRGEAVTAFLYREIRPGISGDFIVLGYDRQPWWLIDSNGGWLRDFKDEVAIAFERRNNFHADSFYADKSGLPDVSTNSYRQPDETGFIPGYDTQSYRQGFVSLRDRTHEIQGLKSAAGRILIPPDRYRGISYNRSGIAVQKDDSCYAYDAAARLRFRCRADGCVQLPGGIVGVSLYGRWALRDSSGNPLSGYDSYRPPEVVGNYIMTHSGVWDFSGRLRLTRSIQSLYPQPGGWYETDGYENNDNQVLDSALKPVFSAGMFERTDFIGDRYILCYKSYSSEQPKVYDRYTHTFVEHLVENALPGGLYVVHEEKRRRVRRILRNGKVQPVPVFSRYKLVESTGLILLQRDTSSREPYGEADDNRVYSSLTSNWSGSTFALIDTTSRIIMPMRYQGIEVLSADVIAAADRRDSSLALFDRAGKVFYKTRLNGAQAKRAGAIVYVTSQSETAVFDTTGKTLYRGAAPPELLYVDKDRPVVSYDELPGPPRLPALLLQEEHLGEWSVRSLSGNRLLPGTYRPFKGKVTGLFSMKRGDSIYVVNHSGRLLYGGRGFSAGDWLPLESYAALVRDGSGKWGMIDAEGGVLLPFRYDSAGRFWFDGNPVSQYFLRRNGLYSWIDNAGRMLSTDADWLPTVRLFGDFYTANNRRTYYLKNARAFEFLGRPPAPDWPRADFVHVDFRQLICCGEKDPGIYNERLQRVATQYRDRQPRFWDDRVVVFDSTGRRLQVVDSVGKTLVPLSKAPVVLMIGEKSIIALDSDGTARIYSAGGNGAPETVVSDTAYTGHLLSGKSQPVDRIHPFVFRGGDGRPAGYVNRRGEVFRPGAEAARHESGSTVLKFPGGWRLYDYNMEPVTPLLFDSVVYQRDGLRLYKDGLEGLYATLNRYRGYIPPLYERLEEPALLENGYLLAANGDSLYLIDRMGRAMTPAFEDFKRQYNDMLNATVTVKGRQLKLHLDRDGVVRMGEGAAGGGAANALQIVWQGDKAGLRNTAADSLVAPVQYDFITRKSSGHFVAWRYKADRHEGVDSTLVYDAAGKRTFSLKGGNDPELKDGFWTIKPGRGTPLLDSRGRVLLGEGYTLSKVLGGRMLLVYRNGKLGLLSAGGKWLLQPELDGLDADDFEETGLMIGKQSEKVTPGSTAEKYFLISSTGKRLTPAIYDSLEIEDESLVIFERGERSGCLNGKGKEVKCREER